MTEPSGEVSLDPAEEELFPADARADFRFANEGNGSADRCELSEAVAAAAAAAEEAIPFTGAIVFCVHERERGERRDRVSDRGRDRGDKIMRGQSLVMENGKTGRRWPTGENKKKERMDTRRIRRGAEKG